MSPSSLLILFLRYPMPGSTKTRLIPALGAQGAASLQRQMAEYLLSQVLSPNWQLQICFTGSCLDSVQNWLGERFSYKAQVRGELGRRLQDAFQQEFESGYERVVVIGADCPDVNLRHIEQAFQRLRSHDLVLGPAQDGGYYLIGLRYPHTAIFDDIDWGTSLVFQQTCTKAWRLGLSMAELEILSDVDRPEDLVVWEKVKRTNNITTNF
ncbi:MAG: TIGR04282 family arsenosugar biosynthesis glycosyltransferase [Phormidesmis sp.]